MVSCDSVQFGTQDCGLRCEGVAESWVWCHREDIGVCVDYIVLSATDVRNKLLYALFRISENYGNWIIFKVK